MDGITLTQALATPCRRCGGLPKAQSGKAIYWIECQECQDPNYVWGDCANAEQLAARQWVEINKEVEDAAYICGAVEDADTWGMGRITLAKQRIEEAGLVWEGKHEQFIFEEFVDD